MIFVLLDFGLWFGVVVWVIWFDFILLLLLLFGVFVNWLLMWIWFVVVFLVVVIVLGVLRLVIFKVKFCVYNWKMVSILKFLE